MNKTIKETIGFIVMMICFLLIIIFIDKGIYYLGGL